MGETTGRVTPGTDAQHDDVKEIRHDIRRTQREISMTLDAIQERLSPRYIMQQTKDSVRRAGVTTSKRFIDKVRDNPIPAAMVGVGLWFLMRDKEDDYDPRFADLARGRVVENEYELYGFDSGLENYAGSVLAGGGRDYSSSRGEKLGNAIDSAKSRVSGAVDTTRDHLGNAMSHAADRVHDVVDSTRERGSYLAESASDRARRLSMRAQRAGHRVSMQSRNFFSDSPLVAGLAAIAVGAIIGAAIPETDKEKEVMGDARDQLAGRARDLASRGVQHAKDIAFAATDAAKSAAAEQAKSSAQELKSEVRSTAQSLKSDVSGNVGVTTASETASTSTSSSSGTARTTTDNSFGKTPSSGSL